MAGRHRIPKKDLEFMAKDIGPELLPFLDTEEVIKHLSPEERLRGLTLEEHLQGLNPEDRLRGLIAEERRTLKQLLENLEKGEKTQR